MVYFCKNKCHANDIHVLWNHNQDVFCSKGAQSPHIHVYYQEHRATVDIIEGNLISGHIPARQLKLVSAWVEIHREELMANWELCQNGEHPFTIEPLK